MTLGSDNIFPSVKVVETASGSLGTIGAGNQRLAIDPTSHLLYWKDNSGTVKTAMTNPMTTAGDTVYGGASGVPTRLAGGTSGYVLTSNGTTSAPSWQASAGGGSGALTLLEQHTASSSATLDFTTAITSTYDEYLIEFLEIVPATNGADLQMLASTNGGSSYLGSSSYHWAVLVEWAGAGAPAAYENTSASVISVTGYVAGGLNNTASKGGYSGSMKLRNPLGTTAFKRITYDGSQKMGDDNFGRSLAHGEILTTSAVNALEFKVASGNIATGIIRMYGVAKT